ncbi:cysteine hydrolase family protein [Nocardia sp. CA-135953]|uniref:cysteine hydrolase family protein n=1 Tax=Nocardia sp. CA-135953 TaxID=3239978 RepID=UPI003D991C16
MHWACLAIDLQIDLCREERRRAMVDDAIPRILRLISEFDRRAMPIYYTKFELDPNDVQFSRFGDRYCIKGSNGAELIDEILPIRGEVIVKEKHSAFFGTDLEERLKDNGVSGIVLTGLQTQICVLTTAADAYYRGFEVIVASDAVISTRDDVRLEAVEWIDKYVGAAKTVEEFISEL